MLQNQWWIEDVWGAGATKSKGPQLRSESLRLKQNPGPSVSRMMVRHSSLYSFQSCLFHIILSQWEKILLNTKRDITFHLVISHHFQETQKTHRGTHIYFSYPWKQTQVNFWNLLLTWGFLSLCSEENDQSGAAPSRVKSITSNTFVFTNPTAQVNSNLLTALLKFHSCTVYGKTPQVSPWLRGFAEDKHVLRQKEGVSAKHIFSSPLEKEFSHEQGRGYCSYQWLPQTLSWVLPEILHK